MQVVAAQFFSGPLPPPDMLIEYNKAFPGCAERIVAMAEEQSRHRQGLEKTNLAGNQQLARRAQLIGGGLALVMLLGGLALAFNDKSVAGLTVIATAVGSILGIAWWGRRTQTKELNAKAKALEDTVRMPEAVSSATSGGTPSEAGP